MDLTCVPLPSSKPPLVTYQGKEGLKLPIFDDFWSLLQSQYIFWKDEYHYAFFKLNLDLAHMEILTQKREIGAYFWPLGAQQWRLFYSCRRQIGAYVKYVEMRHS